MIKNIQHELSVEIGDRFRLQLSTGDSYADGTLTGKIVERLELNDGSEHTLVESNGGLLYDLCEAFTADVRCNWAKPLRTDSGEAVFTRTERGGTLMVSGYPQHLVLTVNLEESDLTELTEIVRRAFPDITS